MFKRYWMFGFAFGLIAGGLFVLFSLVWVIGLNYCPNSPCEYHSADHEQVRNNKYWLPHPFGSDLASDLHPADQEDHPKYYEHQDLDAQQAMADATNAIVWLTFVSMVISIVGACAIIWTLLESRKVTDAAREANAISKSAQRAWINIEGIEFHSMRINRPLGDSGPTVHFDATVKFKNVGDFSATHVMAKTHFRNVWYGPKHPELAKWMKLQREMTMKEGGSILGPMCEDTYEMGEYFWNLDTTRPIREDETICLGMTVCISYRSNNSPNVHQTVQTYLISNHGSTARSRQTLSYGIFEDQYSSKIKIVERKAPTWVPLIEKIGASFMT